MLNELENKIRKAIPELKIKEFGYFQEHKPIQLNHVLEYIFFHKKYSPSDKQIIKLLENYDYMKTFQNQNPLTIIKYINEL